MTKLQSGLGKQFSLTVAGILSLNATLKLPMRFAL